MKQLDYVPATMDALPKRSAANKRPVKKKRVKAWKSAKLL
jgi:hypothetical protein